MIDKPLFGSLTRISDLSSVPFEIERIAKERWAQGDYVVGEVSTLACGQAVELPCGRLTEPMMGDHVVGAFGVRAATLEMTGHWNAIEDDGQMHALTAAGLIGKTTSVSTFVQSPLELQYVGHCVRDGNKLTMDDFVTPASSNERYSRPTVVLIGTSMSSGKTTSAKVIIRQLVRNGLEVAGVKLTGAGRLRDTLAMRDAGAELIMDFVDVGLPSSVCPAEEYTTRIKQLLAKLQAAKPDVVVVEAGASPVEPYNGDSLLELISDRICFTVLCASDPYAVVGVQEGFGYKPDLIAGLCTSTKAGVEVIEKLSGVTALNLLNPNSHDMLRRMLGGRLVGAS